MKKIFLIITALLVASLGYAQQGKYAYVYSEKIFKAIPEYQEAINTLEEYAKYGEEQSKEKLETVKEMYEDYVKIEHALSNSMRIQQRNEIIALEKEANKYQSDFFGENGAMSKKQQELMKPIEDKVLAAVNELAAEKGLDLIFDLSIAKITIFQSNSLDLTNEVIKKLGY